MNICSDGYARSSHGFTGSPKDEILPIHWKRTIQKWTHSLSSHAFSVEILWGAVTYKRSLFLPLHICLFLSDKHTHTHTHTLSLSLFMLWAVWLFLSDQSDILSSHHLLPYQSRVFVTHSHSFTPSLIIFFLPWTLMTSVTSDLICWQERPNKVVCKAAVTSEGELHTHGRRHECYIWTRQRLLWLNW